MGVFQRLARWFGADDNFGKVSWPTHEPRGVVYMPRTRVIEDWRSLNKSAKSARVVPFRKAGIR